MIRLSNALSLTRNLSRFGHQGIFCLNLLFMVTIIMIGSSRACCSTALLLTQAIFGIVPINTSHFICTMPVHLGLYCNLSLNVFSVFFISFFVSFTKKTWIVAWLYAMAMQFRSSCRFLEARKWFDFMNRSLYYLCLWTNLDCCKCRIASKDTTSPYTICHTRERAGQNKSSTVNPFPSKNRYRTIIRE